MSIKNILIIIIMIILLFILSEKENDINEIETNYLDNNSEVINFNDNNDFKIIEDDIKNNRAFITSEIHGIKANLSFKYAFFKFLHENADVDVLILEISISSGYMLNEYLKTGDINILDNIFSLYKGSTFYTKEEYNFFIKLYDYNKSLSDNNKIKIVGIDIEHSYNGVLYYLSYLNEKKKLINFKINQLDDLNFDGNVLNIDEKILLRVIRNINYNKNFYNELDWQYREKKMYQNYLFLQDVYNINKFYAQFGLMHCFKEITGNNFKSIVYFLDKEGKSKVKNNVLVIASIYKNCKYIDSIQYNNLFYYKKYIINKSYRGNNFNKYQDVLLFKLNDSLSPYNNELKWFIDRYEPLSDKVTTDYFEYILLINDSQPSTPMEKNSSIYELIIKFIKK